MWFPVGMTVVKYSVILCPLKRWLKNSSPDWSLQRNFKILRDMPQKPHGARLPQRTLIKRFFRFPTRWVWPSPGSRNCWAPCWGHPVATTTSATGKLTRRSVCFGRFWGRFYMQGALSIVVSKPKVVSWTIRGLAKFFQTGLERLFLIKISTFCKDISRKLLLNGLQLNGNDPLRNCFEIMRNCSEIRTRQRS